MTCIVRRYKRVLAIHSSLYPPVPFQSMSRSRDDDTGIRARQGAFRAEASLPAMSLIRTDTGRPSSSRPATALSRPRTSHSRPNTGRPLTAASSRHDSSYIVAVIVGRGVGKEIGIAALDKDTGRVALVQVCVLSAHTLTLLRSTDGAQARRLPDLRQDITPDASPLSFDRPRS